MKTRNFRLERRLSHRLRILVAVLSLPVFFGFDLIDGQDANNYKPQVNHVERPAGEIIYHSYQPEVPGSRELSDNYPYPPNWETPESSRIDPHFLIVTLPANPRIGEIPIQEGDYIGAFFVGDNGTLVCGGAKHWKADSAIIFAMTGDDPETTHKEGFSYNEVINYKLFSFTTQKDYSVTTINFDTSPGSGYVSGVKWYPLGLSSTTNIKANVTFDAYATANPNPVCLGNPVTLAGNIFIGTTGNYTFNWTSNPPGFSSNLRYPPAVTPLVNTTYNLSVFDGSLTSTHQLLVVVDQNPSQVNAGTDITVCATQAAQIEGSAINYGSILWTTSGTGLFNNATIFNPVYTPGISDKQNGSVVLTLTVQPPQDCTIAASDQLTLTILPLPTVNAGLDISGCKGSPVSLNATAANFSTVQWTTEGDGTFNNAQTLNPQYYPGNTDITTGNITLNVLVNATTPCTETSSDQILITLINPPTACGPTTKQLCETTPTVTINGSATNYSSVYWTTAGDGIFTNPNTLVAVYATGTNDRLAGETTVTLHAMPNNPCTIAATKDILIIIKRNPVIDAGNTNSVNPGQSLQLNASASFYSLLQWTSSGNGEFINSNSPTAIYTPGSIDIAAGQFTLTLTGTAIAPCNLSVSDNLLVVISGQPTVQINTPSNQTLCAPPPFQLSASATNYAHLLWTTSGNGTFNDSAVLNPVYTPGTADMSGMPVTLTLTAFAAGSGSNVTDQILVSFIAGPTANAGSDAAICQGSTHTLAGTASNQASILWSTSGNGTFSSTSSFDPDYYPGTIDVLNGTVTLTLTAFAQAPCTVATSDNKILTIQKNPTANAGTDATILETESFLVSATAANYSSILWQTGGDGTFSNPALLNPVYFPGAADIENSNVVLTIFASPNNPCPGAATDALTLTIMRQQIIQIPAGWSGFSSFVLPLNPAFAAVMSPVANNLIVAKSMMEVYWPEFEVNTIGNFDPAKGYLVKMNNAAALPISGFEFENKTISLTTGWNILPVLSGVNVNAQLLTGQLGNKLIIVTEIAGTGIIWPDQGISTLPFLIPGKAYMIKISSPGLFTFPD